MIDGSSSMDRRLDATTPRTRAIEWARRFVRGSRPGDSIAVLVAGERTRPLIDPPSFDLTRVDETLAGVKPARGSSDIPAALVEAFRILGRTRNPGRTVIVLTDGQRQAWRPRIGAMDARPRPAPTAPVPARDLVDRLRHRRAVRDAQRIGRSARRQPDDGHAGLAGIVLTTTVETPVPARSPARPN